MFTPHLRATNFLNTHRAYVGTSWVPPKGYQARAVAIGDALLEADPNREDPRTSGLLQALTRAIRAADAMHLGMADRFGDYLGSDR